MKKITTLEIKWAVTFFLFSLVWMFFEKSMGWHDVQIERHASMTGLFAIPAISIYVFALLEKKKNHLNNFMTWKQGFTCGIMITFIYVLLSPIAQYITFTFITPDFFSNMVNYSVNVLGESREKMEANFNMKSYMLQGITGALIMGIITSAIVALFVKRSPVIKPEANGSITR